MQLTDSNSVRIAVSISRFSWEEHIAAHRLAYALVWTAKFSTFRSTFSMSSREMTYMASLMIIEVFHCVISMEYVEIHHFADQGNNR